MPVCNCPPACTKSRFNDISLLVLCSSVVVMQYCSSVVGVVVHILLLGGGEVLLVLFSSVVDCSVLHCSCSVVGEDHSLPDHWFLSCCGLRARY